MELDDYQQAIGALRTEADKLEQEFIEKALLATDPPGNICQVAKTWGIPRVKIYRRLKQMNKKPNSFRV